MNTNSNILYYFNEYTYYYDVGTMYIVYVLIYFNAFN